MNILPVLSDELGDYRARTDPSASALVFGTATGRRQGATNVRRRVLAKAVEHANTKLAKDDGEPLPDGLTPHSLRRTFASLLFALGEPPPYVMAQMGHTTASLTLAIYARQMDRRDGEPARLKALVSGAPSPRPRATAAGSDQTPGLLRVGLGGVKRGGLCSLSNAISSGAGGPSSRMAEP